MSTKRVEGEGFDKEGEVSRGIVETYISKSNSFFTRWVSNFCIKLTIELGGKSRE